MATFGSFADLTPAQLELAQRRQATGGDPLSNLLQGLQQGVQLQQLPQELANQAIATQLATQLAQSKLAAIPLEQERQQLLVNQLRAQLDPNYAAQQREAELSFAEEKARRLGRVQQQLAQPAQTQLKFTETNDEIITQNPFTGVEVGRVKKTPGVKYEKTERGLLVIPDPAKPLEGSIFPGTEPITSPEGSLAPIYDPADPTKILGYTVPKNFKSVGDIKGTGVTGGKAPTASQENFQLYGNRMEASNTALEKIDFEPIEFGEYFPNRLKSTDRQLYEQAQRDFINAALRKESGAVISAEEFQNARQQYFPQAGDSDAVKAQKKNNRLLVISEFKRLGGSQTDPQNTGTASATEKKPGESTSDFLKRKYAR